MKENQIKRRTALKLTYNMQQIITTVIDFISS